jgi:dUTP pyrophosphatase
MGKVIEVKFKKLEKNAVIPKPANEFAVGWDLTTIWFDEEGQLLIGHTGLAVEIPDDYFMLICVRSSASTKGFMMANGVGIIDPDYRGEIITKFLRNTWRYHDSGPLILTQAMLLPRTKFKAVEASELSKTSRGTGGFGSTDKK